MLFVYPALFHKEDGYWVEFPDLDGCFTQGDTLDETMANAQEALAAYVESKIKNGEKLNDPSDIQSVEKPEDGFVTLVSGDADLSDGEKSVKKTLTIPKWLNDRALAKNINFSKALQETLVRKIV